MRKMDEIEFEKLRKDIPVSVKQSSNHPEVVKLYYLGSNTEYGCLKCGLQHHEKVVFDKPGMSGWM